MPTLTNEQAIGYARNAGFSGQDLVRIVAIGRSESGLRTDAHNPETLFNTRNNCGGKCSSEGWLQVLTCLANSSPNKTCHYDRGTPEYLHDPQNCANEAFKLYQGRKTQGQSGFEDWSVYNSGAYLLQMPFVSSSMGMATSPRQAGFDLPSTETVLGGMENGEREETCLVSIPNPLGKDLCIFKASWGIRSIEAIGGIIMILLGVLLLATELGLSTIASKAGKALKPAKQLVGAVKNAG
jgi:hypothetical protein